MEYYRSRSMLFSIANTDEYITMGMGKCLSIINLKEKACVKIQENLFETNEFCYHICIKKIDGTLYLVIGTTEKRILILKVKENYKIEIYKIHKFPKTISNLYISCINELYMTDKFGDCYRVCVPEGNIEYITGHISMLLGVIADSKYIITGDRDETIKVTDRVHPHVIISYLMGHENYISSLQLVNNRWLISGGGDNYISIWDNVANPEQIPTKIQLSNEPIKLIDITSDEFYVFINILNDPHIHVVKLNEQGSEHDYKKIKISGATEILKTIVTDRYILIIYNIDGNVNVSFLNKDLTSYENREVQNLIMKGIDLVKANDKITGDMMIDHPRQKKEVIQKSLLPWLN